VVTVLGGKAEKKDIKNNSFFPIKYSAVANM
jgi:hypothetical protein